MRDEKWEEKARTAGGGKESRFTVLEIVVVVHVHPQSAMLGWEAGRKGRRGAEEQRKERRPTEEEGKRRRGRGVEMADEEDEGERAGWRKRDYRMDEAYIRRGWDGMGSCCHCKCTGWWSGEERFLNLAAAFAASRS